MAVDNTLRLKNVLLYKKYVLQYCRNSIIQLQYTIAIHKRFSSIKVKKYESR